MDRHELIALAVNLANANGLINLSRQSVCAAARIPDGSFWSVTGGNFSDFLEEVRQRVRPEALHAKAVSRNRANPELRREQILAAAVTQAETVGIHKVTRNDVADRAGVSPALVSFHLGTLPNMNRAIMRAAIRTESVAIVAQGLAGGDPHAKNAPPELKERALAHLAANS